MNVIEWGSEYLSSHGYILKSNFPENVKETPWSSVMRFTTSDGYIYLKQTPKLLGLEATITRILHDQFHAGVPEIIANNSELDCFLMKDAGRPLREILLKNFDVALLCQAILQFTSLQLLVADNIEVMLDNDVPDWRLEKIPALYQQLLSNKTMLIEDGLSEIEWSHLDELTPMVAKICDKLSAYSIPQTIVQPDFHDNNILIDHLQKLTLIDLGEIVISHPFFSSINCLHQIKKHHGLSEHDERYQQLMLTSFQNYKNVESETNLEEAFALAQLLLPVYGALASERLLEACGKEKLLSYHSWKLSNSLKELLKINF